MKKIAVVLLLVVSLECYSQSTSTKYFDLAKRAFELKLDSSDFSEKGICSRKGPGHEFFMLMVDTVETNCPGSFYFLKYSTASEMYAVFSQIVRSINWQGEMYEYKEIYDNPFFPFNSPLHTIFYVNGTSSPYVFEIWHNPKDLSKIDGFAITMR